MDSLSCILLIVERSELIHRGLHKALLLARHAGARLELLLCETGRYQSSPPDDYLRAMRQSIVSADVPISYEAVSAPSLPEALAGKLRRTAVQMVVRPLRPEHAPGSGFDWGLINQCSAPLLLTGGRPWRPVPRFAAAVDLSDRGDARLCRQIVQMCETLARSCGAQLDFLFANAARARGLTAKAARERLDALRSECETSSGELRYWTAKPSQMLPRVVARQDYDLLALDRRSDMSAALMNGVEGDVLLVGGASEDQAGVDASNARAAAGDSMIVR